MDTPSVRIACLIGLALLWSATGASAQEPDSEEPLYEIAPREIEIRGRLEVDLPSLERQPLRDLAPTVKVPTLPPTYRPFVGTYKRTLEDIPQQLPEPTPPADALTPSGPVSAGALTAGGGRYLTRFAHGRVHVPLSPSESLELRGDYDGSEGHTPVDDGPESAYDVASARIAFESRRSAYILSANVHGFWDSYTLYGVPQTTTAPDRTGVSGGTGVDLQTRTGVPIRVGLTYDETSYETEDRTVDESRAQAHARVEVPLGSRTFRLDGAATASGLNGAFAADGDLTTLDAGASLTLVDTPTASLDAGARILTFDGVIDPSAAVSSDASAQYIAPSVDGRVRLASALELYASWTPQLTAHSLNSTLAENPYTTDAPLLLPTLETTHVEGGARVTAGPVALRGFAGYRYAPSFQYFVDTPATPGRFGIFYDSAEILQGGLHVALNGLNNVHASAQLLVRDGTLSDTDQTIPNFASVVGEGSVMVSFADQAAFVELTGTVESPRDVDRSTTTEVGTYADVDVRAAYALTSALELVARVENIGSSTLERWARYPQPPTIVATGLRLRW